MSTLVTQADDPILWQKLYDEYVLWNCPGHVYLGDILYRVEFSPAEVIQFRSVDTLDYLDSRSLSNSRKTSYKKLDGTT